MRKSSERDRSSSFNGSSVQLKSRRVAGHAGSSALEETKETHARGMLNSSMRQMGAVSLPQLPSHTQRDSDGLPAATMLSQHAQAVTHHSKRHLDMTAGREAFAMERSGQTQAWESSQAAGRRAGSPPGGGLGLGTDSAVLHALTEARLKAAPGGSLLHTLTPAGKALGGHAAAALAASGATEIMAAVERQVGSKGRGRRNKSKRAAPRTPTARYIPPGVSPPADPAVRRRAERLGVPETHPLAQPDPLDAPDLTGAGVPLADRSGVVRTQRLAGAEVRRTARAVILQRDRAADPSKASDPAQAAAASSAKRLAATSRLPSSVRDRVAAAAEPPVPDWAQDVPLPLLLAPGRRATSADAPGTPQS